MTNNFVIVMSSKSRANFDFVGILVEKSDSCIVLKNPLAMVYSENLAFDRLDAAYLPIGLAYLNSSVLLTIPMEDIAYFVELENSAEVHPIIQEYNAFFKVNANPQN